MTPKTNETALLKTVKGEHWILESLLAEQGEMKDRHAKECHAMTVKIVNQRAKFSMALSMLGQDE